MVTVSAVCALAGVGCGEGKSGVSSGVVAEVGHEPITKAELHHRLTTDAIEAHDSIPDPPNFHHCIAESQGRERAKTATQLERSCEQLYQKLRAQALGELISGRWLIGEAASEGEPVSAHSAKLQLEQARHRLFPAPAAFTAFLSKTKKTVADLLFEFEVSQASSKIRRRLRAHVGTVTPAQVHDYYVEHRAEFHEPERRDLAIIRTATEAEALRARRKIQAGASFASIVEHIKLEQPIFSKKGNAPGVARGLYKEEPLNRAIFRARPDVLSGPTKIPLGYYVFEVKRITPAHERTLAQVQGLIRQRLPEITEKHELAQFISGWRARWTAKTKCNPGYVVPKCREHHSPPGSTPEEPLLLR